MQIELSQPRKIANYKWKYSGCHRIKGAEMPNRALAEDTPGAADHVV
jgi:hypothetical protein